MLFFYFVIYPVLSFCTKHFRQQGGTHLFSPGYCYLSTNFYGYAAPKSK